MTMLLSVIAPVFAVIALGRVSIVRRWIEPGALPALNDIVFYAAMPALIFSSLVRAERLEMADATVAFLAATFMIYGVGMVLARLLLGARFAVAAVVGLNACFGNAVMMGIPVVVAAFGPDALVPLLGIIVTHSAVLLPTATILIEFGNARGSAGSVLRATFQGLIRNPVILTMVLAFAWRASGVPLPGALDNFCRLIGGAGPPLALFCLGASLPPASAGAKVIREVALAVPLRLIATPALMLGIGAWFGLSGLAYQVAVLIAGMPTGANAFILARRTETAQEASAATVVVATGLSVITLSVLLTLL